MVLIQTVSFDRILQPIGFQKIQPRIVLKNDDPISIALNFQRDDSLVFLFSLIFSSMLQAGYLDIPADVLVNETLQIKPLADSEIRKLLFSQSSNINPAYFLVSPVISITVLGREGCIFNFAEIIGSR